jgi:hemolysin activation/secretion protein
VLFLFLFSEVNAQYFHLDITTENRVNTQTLSKLHFIKLHKNRKSANDEIKNISQQLTKIGYFNNSYKIIEKDTLIKATFSLHKKIDSIRVYYKSVFDTNALNKLHHIKIDKNYFETSTNQIENVLNSIIKYYETNGYPFTTVYLKNLKAIKNSLLAELVISSLQKRYFSKILIKGYSNFPKKFLTHFVNVKQNDIFNKKKLNLINEQLNQIPFITQIKKPAVLFSKDSTTLFLYLKKKSNNSFDGIIGFYNEPNTNKIQLNGYLDLNLNNIFNNGETLNLNWKSFQKSSKSLNVLYKAPYVFNSSITPEINFIINKIDSTYLNSKIKVNLHYQLNQNNDFSIIFTSEKSSLTESFKTNNSFADYNNNYYGVSYSYFKRNTFNKLLPFKFQFETNLLFGNRDILNTKESQTKFNINATYLLNINKKNSLQFKTENAVLNSKSYYQNELFRIGGANSIQGFDEQSIFTSKYSFSSLKYFYILNNENALYTLTDFALTKNLDDLIHTYYSIGLGILFKSKKNIINLSYVLGLSDQTAFNIKNSKFHFKISYPF